MADEKDDEAGESKVLNGDGRFRKKLLSAEDLFSLDDVRYVDVECPEWGCIARLRSLTGAEALQFTEDRVKGDGPVRLFAMSAVDESGKNLFTVDDIPRLKRKAFKPFVRCQEAALELNGIQKLVVKSEAVDLKKD